MTQSARAESARAEALVWACLSHLAKSEFVRDEITAGKYEILIDLTADVDGETVTTAIAANLTVQSSGVYHPSIKAPADHLLACLWDKLTPDDQVRLERDLPLHYETHKTLPDVSDASLTAIKKLTARLTARGRAKPKAGAITATRI